MTDMAEPEQVRLTDADVQRFIHDGFVRVDGAFPSALADEARAILWRDTGCDPEDPATWLRPVVRLGMYTARPFVSAANTAVLHDAFDRLVGPGRWLPCRSVGTFRCAFPSAEEPGDTGWHVDASFGHDDPDFLAWRVNVSSRGRALLVLLLFSDVGEDDAPTRLRVGSHLQIARALAPAGQEGLALRDLAQLGLDGGGTEALATGAAGTAYLCHPFLVHAAQRHRGTRPRFLAQPPLLPRVPIDLSRDHEQAPPVEAAIRIAIAA
jgi:hypothetical protein